MDIVVIDFIIVIIFINQVETTIIATISEKQFRKQNIIHLDNLNEITIITLVDSNIVTITATAMTTSIVFVIKNYGIIINYTIYLSSIDMIQSYS